MAFTLAISRTHHTQGRGELTEKERTTETFLIGDNVSIFQRTLASIARVFLDCNSSSADTFVVLPWVCVPLAPW